MTIVGELRVALAFPLAMETAIGEICATLLSVTVPANPPPPPVGFGVRVNPVIT
jgi:hypothetical protein